MQPKQTRWLQLLSLLVLSVITLYQMYIVVDNYAALWLKRTWRNIHLSSMERNALFLFGGQGAEFMAFIAAEVPLEHTVVIPEEYGEHFRQQNFLQFFLMPHKSIACGCEGFINPTALSEACKACLLKENHAVPAIGRFPPDEWIETNKVWIPFEGTGWYRGIYVTVAPSGGSSDPYIEMDTPIRAAVFLDGLAIALIAILGISISLWIIPNISGLDLLVLGIPLGVGTLSWMVFLLSWAGIPISLGLFIGTLLVLNAVFIFFSRQSLVRFRQRWDFPRIVQATRQFVEKPLLGVLLMCVLFLFASSIIISIGRGYSLYDGIANWALKGYAIALERSIFAGQDWGGHSLSYPQNIHLTIALFRLLDGDVLPGSKAIFPLFGLSLLLGCYSFWRKSGLGVETASVGLLMLFSIPFFFYHTTIGWANLIFSTYLVLGAFYLGRGVEKNHLQNKIVGGLLLASATWTRPEGIGYAVGYIILFGFAGVVFTGRPQRNMVWTLPTLVVGASWLLFSSNSIANDEIGDVFAAFFSAIRAGEVRLVSPLAAIFSFALRQFSDPGIWGWVGAGILFLLILAVSQRKTQVDLSIVLTTAAGIIAFAIPVFMFYLASYSKPNLVGFLDVSFDRTQFHAVFLLFSALLAASAPKEIIPGPRHTEHGDSALH